MFRVQRKMCDQCLFSDKKIVSDARKADLLKQCLKKDTHFNCHKTQVIGSDEPVCCRGFFDKFHTQNIRIALRLGAVEFVDVE